MKGDYKLIGISLLIIALISSAHFYASSETAADTTPPVTTLEFAGPHYIDGGTEWISSKTTIWINATDDISGTKILHYEIWRDADNDGKAETLVISQNVYDNSFNDRNKALKKIAYSTKIYQECFHKIVYYSTDYAGNVEYYGIALVKEWNYSFQPIAIHIADSVRFGSSAAIDNLTGDESLEIFVGSDELRNFFPEINATAKGLWRCFDAYGNILYALDTKTDEARSSPAIADIDGDGIKEVAAGTTSGWFLEVMEDGHFEWTFPSLNNGPVYGGPYVWHSSPAIADVNDEVDGMEIIIGNNPHESVWCFDGDNSDGVDEGFTLPMNAEGNSSYFQGFPKPLGNEGVDWDVLWVFNTSGKVIATPAIADVNNDGKYEVAVGDLAGVFYLIDAKTGTQLWNFTTGGAIYSSPAVADVNGDGEYEIIFGSNDYKLYCLNSSGTQLWNFTTGGAIYSSPAVADVNGDKYAKEWPMFRGNLFRNGTYPEKGKKLSIFVGSEDHYLYEISWNGSLINKFLSNGKIHTSPSIADVDGDGFQNILFYDWGSESGTVDTFWCLERIDKNVKYVRVDTKAPQTVKQVLSKDEYNITSLTNIWLNATDDGNCSSGVKYLHYEIRHDTDDDGTVDIMVESKTIYDNDIEDVNSLSGEISILIHLTNLGINEIRWYAEDNVGNRESMHFQEHNVIVYEPILSITKTADKSIVHPGYLLNYTLTIENTGNANATNVIVTEV
ncbi:MAG: PQQ-binding-like beta-propeller repeat protein, partial [Thermoplasmata archaeon]|nr:PQQ-binding-like beta-propeller repeat protein [Thermoplasmata archaeon]